jgi:P27 family predicted phage terminase small subunit
MINPIPAGGESMARPRQPVELILTKGAKHLTKAEIKSRMQSEVKPCTDCIEPPAYLTAAQKRRFGTIAEQLMKIRILGETDAEALARYITSEDLYRSAVRDVRAAQKCRPRSGSAEEMAAYAMLLDKLDKRLDRYFRQAHTAASALGLTISSRCKLVVPKADEGEKPVNKFKRFEKAAGA